MQTRMQMRIKAEANAGHNTFTNGHNTIINVTDNSTGIIAVALSTLLMMEGLKGNENSEHIESLIKTLNGLLKGDSSNHKAIIDAINSLNKK